MEPIRKVTPFISRLRNYLSGRPLVDPNRHEQNQAPRSQPPPRLPGGLTHQIKANYYYTRDGRRESKPPNDVPTKAALKAIEASPEAGTNAAPATPKPAAPLCPKPGFGYNWETGKADVYKPL